MNLTVMLLLVLAFFWFYFNGPYWAAWITGVLVLLIVLAKLFEGVLSVGKAGAKEFTRDMEADMEKASGKGPSGEYLTEVVREAGRKSGEYLGAPESYVYKQKDLIGNLSQGAKNFFEGINALFGGKYTHHPPSEKSKQEHKPKPAHEPHHEESHGGSSHGHGETHEGHH